MRICSFNILNTSCRYEERGPLINDAIRRLNPDLIGLQEVNLEQVPDIQGSFDAYPALLPEPSYKSDDPKFRIDGNMILAKPDSCRVVGSSEILYSSRERIGQKIEVRVGDLDLIFINTHLDHVSDSTRTEQIKELLSWLDLGSEKNMIVVGDFNSRPTSDVYKIMSQHFTSAVKHHAGKEPILTYPTGLYGENPSISWYGCLDYVWVRGNIEIENAGILWDIGSGNLFASDHYPVFADIKILK